jgi:hypothetical protein
MAEFPTSRLLVNKSADAGPAPNTSKKVIAAIDVKLHLKRRTLILKLLH